MHASRVRQSAVGRCILAAAVAAPGAGTGGQNLDLALVIADGCGNGKADPAFDAHMVPLVEWAMAVCLLASTARADLRWTQGQGASTAWTAKVHVAAATRATHVRHPFPRSLTSPNCCWQCCPSPHKRALATSLGKLTIGADPSSLWSAKELRCLAGIDRLWLHLEAIP